MPELKVQRCSEALLALMGIWLIVSPLPSLVAWVLSLLMSQSQRTQDSFESRMLVAQLIAVLCSVVLGLILITLRKRLAHWLAPEPSSNTISAQMLLAVGAALVGVYFLVSGASSLAAVVIVRHNSHTFDSVRQLRRFWVPVTDLVVGLALFAFSTSVARVWQLLRGRLDPNT